MPSWGKTCRFAKCKSRSKIHPDKRFYPFVKPTMDREKCLRWIAASGNTDLCVNFISKEFYVCSDHFVGGGPSAEHPDPLPYREEESNRENALEQAEPAGGYPAFTRKKKDLTPTKSLLLSQAPHGNVTPSKAAGRSPQKRLQGEDSPARRAALKLKRKALTPKRSGRLGQQSPGQYDSVAGGNVEGNKTTPGVSTPKTLPAADVLQSTPDISSERKFLHTRNLFDDFMADIENETDGNTTSEPTVSRTTKERISAPFCANDGTRSVATQTLSRWTLRRLRNKERESGTNPDTVVMEQDCSVSEGDDEDDVTNPGTNTRGARGRGEKGERFNLSYESVQSDFEFEFLCELSRDHFDVLYEFIGGDEVYSLLKYEAKGSTPRVLRASRISLRCRLFMTLCRLRRGFTEQELAIFFGCSLSLVSRILNTWINFLFAEFKPLEPVMFQDRESQKSSTPKRFKSFKGLRVVIDCTEIRVQTPSNFQQQGNTWSSYKHKNTVKYLIGINVHGAICYVSEAFEGSMSDEAAFIRSSMYDLLRPGDVVMADRGFDIAKELDRIKVDLVIPSYLKGRDYLAPEEEIRTKKIARARIFVENAIGRLKNWRILDAEFRQSTIHLVAQMVFVCACLSNFQTPLL